MLCLDRRWRGLAGWCHIMGARPVSDYIVYESTVFPGATEEICIPELERASGLDCGVDFFVGYSPERINIGENKKMSKDIIKITSGSNQAASKIIDK